MMHRFFVHLMCICRIPPMGTFACACTASYTVKNHTDRDPAFKERAVPGRESPWQCSLGRALMEEAQGTLYPALLCLHFPGYAQPDCKTPSCYPELPAPSLKSGPALGCLEEPLERKVPHCRESLRSWPQTGLELPLDHSEEGNTKGHVTMLCPEILWQIASSNGSISPAIHLLPNYGCQELLESAAFSNCQVLSFSLSILIFPTCAEMTC